MTSMPTPAPAAAPPLVSTGDCGVDANDAALSVDTDRSADDVVREFMIDTSSSPCRMM
jgi:hypothetical protein